MAGTGKYTVAEGNSFDFQENFYVGASKVAGEVVRKRQASLDWSFPYYNNLEHSI